MMLHAVERDALARILGEHTSQQISCVGRELVGIQGFDAHDLVVQGAQILGLKGEGAASEHCK